MDCCEIGSTPAACALTATPARVWVCSTHCASSRTAWIELWITKPARLTGKTESPRLLPSWSISTSDDAVISSNIRPYGLIRKLWSSPGTRALMCVNTRSLQP